VDSTLASFLHGAKSAVCRRGLRPGQIHKHPVDFVYGSYRCSDDVAGPSEASREPLCKQDGNVQQCYDSANDILLDVLYTLCS